MKKFISMVMAAAMVVSLVPATAFAANTATFKVVNDKEFTEAEADAYKKNGTATITDPQIQLKVKDVDNSYSKIDTWDVTLDFNGAELKEGLAAGYDVSLSGQSSDLANVKVTVKDAAEAGDDTVKLVVTELANDGLKDDDVIGISMTKLKLYLTKVSKGAKATVEVSGDFGDSDALTFASVLDDGLKVTLKKVADVAEDETTNLERELKIETTVGKFKEHQVLELKLNSGFEWTAIAKNSTIANGALKVTDVDDNVLTTEVTATGAGTDTITIAKGDLTIDAADSKVGAVAKITVKAKTAKVGSTTVGFNATADAVEAAKVVGDTVTMSVDEDEDVPVIYSGVNVDNYGITDDSDHKALEVTLEESVKEALNSKKSFTLTLPKGVYVTDVDVTKADDVMQSDKTAFTSQEIEAAFKDAYKKGEQDNFEFARRVFGDSTKAFEMSFEMTLIAEPTFEGDVTLTLGGDAFDKEQTVTIAKFVKPYTVEASQNNLIIDYRNTKVPTNVVVKEAEAGLWAKDKMDFIFNIEKDKMEFEDDVTFTVDDKSDMEVKAVKSKDMSFKVTDESDDAAAAVTISDISLYMSRDIAAGAYGLELYTTATQKMLTEEKLFTTDTVKEHTDGYYVADYIDMDYDGASSSYNANNWEDKTYTVKEGFVNIVTAGKDKDNTFTTKVVVPVGEKYLIAGEEQVALDVPAYISADGYTMLPVRAVATALGINNSSVIWNQATKTVTIMYGQRIITMVAGQKVITVNGNTIPASATVQIKDGRTFLPLRDLATALNVADITWDAATKTATLNGNQK